MGIQRMQQSNKATIFGQSQFFSVEFKMQTADNMTAMILSAVAKAA